jgi:S1-C subfamily serine protease
MLRLVTVILSALLAAVPSSGQDRPAGTIKLFLPNTTWVLEIPAMGFAVQRDTTRPDGHGRSILAVDKATGLNLSVFLDRVPSSADSKQCRQFYWERLQRSPLKREQIKMSERGTMALLEYTVRDAGPVLQLPEDVRKLLGEFEQRHLNAYHAWGGVCIDIHLSKVVKPGDQAPPFGSFLDGVRLIDAGQAGPNTPAQHLAAKVRASVVVVHVQKKPAAIREPTLAAGSGFFVSREGHVVVASHVVENAANIEIALPDGRRLVADLVGRDGRSGLRLALLKVGAQPSGKYTPLGFAANEAKIGDRVLVVSGGGEVTEALIQQGKDEFLHARVDGGRRVDGPLVNGDGEIVAVVLGYLATKDGKSANVGVAVPARAAARVVKELLSKGRIQRGWLGLTLANFEPDIWAEFGLPRPNGSKQAPAAGAHLKKLEENGPAYAAGLRAGDRILKLNGDSVRTAGELLRRIGNFEPRTTVSLTIVRDGTEQVLTLTLGVSPNQ